MRGLLGAHQFGGHGLKRPVQPWGEGVEIIRLHRGPTPDAQTWRGVSITANIQRDAFLLEKASDALGEIGLGFGR